ncbi:hypothetical protein Pmani_014524 [Petrolisthes manimaculis]|uniref:Peptidase S1 domain-containing protein n=1 Tax=Petrolisthes manimaculis TaxID=1843537 RepID=A0AAE1PST9_9EUCA|nr:hypothetical protein Pmani_014524 [Petrolisthes manimaculis]
MRPSLFILAFLGVWCYSQVAVTAEHPPIEPKDGGIHIDPKLLEHGVNERQSIDAPPQRRAYRIFPGDVYSMVPSKTSGKAKFKWAFKAKGDCEVISLTCGTNFFSSPKECMDTMKFTFKEGGTTQNVKPDCGTDVSGISASTNSGSLVVQFRSLNRKNRFDFTCSVMCDADTTGSTKVCGDPTLLPTRVVGGTTTTIDEYPWQCGLTSRTTSTNPFCGCSIVNNRYIVTAAHCVVGSSPNSFTVAVGSTDITSGTTRVAVSRITVHENYNNRNLQNDIAVLELASPLTFSDTVMPVCAPDTSNDFVGETATATGWGTLASGGSQPSILQEVDLTVMSNSQCASAYNFNIPNVMICATDAGKDTCQGDSGGPLVVPNSDSVYSLVGITSWGIGCATNPGVYTRVTEYVDWVNNLVSSGQQMCV